MKTKYIEFLPYTGIIFASTRSVSGVESETISYYLIFSDDSLHTHTTWQGTAINTHIIADPARHEFVHDFFGRSLPLVISRNCFHTNVYCSLNRIRKTANQFIVKHCSLPLRSSIELNWLTS